MYATLICTSLLSLMALLCQPTDGRPFQAPLPREESGWQTGAGSANLVADPYPQLPLLSFDKRGKFKLAVFSDTHMLDGQTNPANVSNVNAATAAEVASYLRTESPDYVFHNGDVVSGEAANGTSVVEAAVKQLFTPLIKAKIPFSTTHGNHDNDNYCTHASLGDVERRIAPNLSYTRRAPAGVGGGDVGSDNYWVPIYPRSNAKRGSRPALLIWSLDSRSGKTLKEQGNTQIDSFVDPSVAIWLNRTSSNLQRAWGTLPPSLIFTHIPNHYFSSTQNADPYQDKIGGITDERPGNFPGNDSSPRTFSGLNEDKPLANQGDAGQDQPYLTALSRGSTGTSRIHALVSGHDHGNDWCAPSGLTTIKGEIVPICFAKKTGDGGYDYDNWNHGTRIFDFDLKTVEQSVNAYIRLKTGEKRYETRLDDAWSRKL
ncbi:Predicted DNA repair exonuclease SIA1 [Ceraceosorus bombacis]|uniref:Predicted DNA repair exonuclease SIA1 n=1 Tax=Ceraceosorus bombacis TaxID=401625 RepID=A0A0N7L9N4_9BASI|nr:Predicted DNA repair exonuclease SIA1 [Ceraceosorus bombacis]